MAEGRSDNWQSASVIRARKSARKADGISGEREKRLAIRSLVLSDAYQYLKDEAAASLREPQQPTDGNSLIAYLAGSIRRDAISALFNRLESLAGDIPEAVHHQTTRKTER